MNKAATYIAQSLATAFTGAAALLILYETYQAAIIWREIKKDRHNANH